MIVKKRCDCAANCDHHYHFSFKHSGLKVPHRESTHTKNYKLAVRIADRRKDEIIAAAAGVGPVAPITAKLSELVTKFRAWYATEYPSTAATATRVLPGFQKSFPDDPCIVDVKPFDLQRWRSQRLTAVIRDTVQTEYMVVRSMFREAKTWYPGFVSPTKDVPLWTLADKEVVIPTEDEVQLALSGLPPHFAAMCEVTIETLARVSEVSGLTVRDIGASHSQAGTVYWLWRRLKGGKRRRIQISEALYTALTGFITRADQQFIFEARNKKGVSGWIQVKRTYPLTHGR